MNVYEKLGDPVAAAVFIATLLLPIAVGLLAMRRTKNQSDFFLGGRAMGRFTVALSAVASGRSSWLVLGVSGMAWTMGASAVWAIAGYTAAEALQFVTIGRRLRTASAASESLTLLDYFAARFADRHHWLRITGALIIGIFITAYVAAQFNAGAKTLTAALDIPFHLTLPACGLLILVYMVLGGFVAVAWNDVVRAIIMIVGLIVLPVVTLVQAGGLDQLAALLPAAHLSFSAVGAGAVIGFLGIGLGSPGQPHVVVRYMSIRDERQLVSAALIGTFWNIALGLGAVAIGLVGRALVPNITGLPHSDPEMIYLVLSARCFDPVWYGLLVGGIFAAILSTADSQLLVVASTVVRDIREKMMGGEHVDERARLRLSRTVVVLSGLLAMGLALLADDLVFWLVLFAWGGLGASLGPALIASLYWRRTSRAGVLAGMIAGTSVTIVWKLLLKDATGVYELIPAFAAASLCIVVFSLWRPDPDL